MRLLRSLSVTSLILLAGACTDTPPLVAEISTVTPAALPELLEAELTLQGERLFIRTRTDFTQGTTEPVGAYRVALRGADGEVALPLLEHPNATTLRVGLPAGIGRGRYTLALTDPWERVVTVENAVRLMGPCEEPTGPAPGDPCDGADSDLCPDEVYECEGGVLVCVTGADAVEVCDGEDNDCNPATPDGAHEPTLGEGCEGPDGDLCADDTVVCEGGVLACATGPTNLELCDGQDNDCNPATADGAQDPEVGQLCEGTDSDLCLDDVTVCQAGAVVCDAGSNTPDLCNGVDDDCNPATPDGSGEPTLGNACDGSDLDACEEGTLICQGTAMVCDEAPEDYCGAAIKVGTFTKSTVTPGGPAVTQLVPHGLGRAPGALLFFSVGASNTNYAVSHLLSMGLVDETRSGARSHASSSSDDEDNAQTSRRYADAAMTFTDPDGVTLAEAQVTGWDATHFTLRWDVNDAAPRRIHFLALSSSVLRSRVVKWQLPPVNDSAAQTVTGVGFAPTTLLNLGSGAQLTAAPPATLTGDAFSFSASDDQAFDFTTSLVAGPDPNVSSYVAARRAQRTQRFVNSISTAGDVAKSADLTALTQDGFTLGWNVASGGPGRQSALALSGIRSRVVCFNRRTTPGAQSVTGFGFRPMAVLLASHQGVAGTDPLNHGHFGFGASDGVTSAAMAIAMEHGLSFSLVRSLDRDSAFVQVGPYGALEAEASLTAFASDGFDLDWTTVNGSPAQVCAVGFGP